MSAIRTPSPPVSPAGGGTPVKAWVDWTRHHASFSYFVIAFTLSWAVWMPMALAGARVDQGQVWPTHIPGLFGPMAAAFIMSAMVAGRGGVRGLVRRMVLWRVAAKWYLVAVSPLACYAIVVTIQRALGGGWPDLAQMSKFSSLPVVAVPVMLLLLLVTAFAEETGWRGFAVQEMLKTRSFLWTAIVIGLLWALWHVPSMFVIENYRQMGIAMFPMFTLGIVSGSIVLTWLYRGSGGSVFIVALWHACYNLVSGTAAGAGAPAAIVSAAIMVWAVIIVVAEAHRGRPESAAKPHWTATATSL